MQKLLKAVNVRKGYTLCFCRPLSEPIIVGGVETSPSWFNERERERMIELMKSITSDKDEQIIIS